MHKLRTLAFGVIALYIGIAAALFYVMKRPILFGKVMRHVPGPAMMAIPFKQLWFVARAGSLKRGDPAPTFSLPTPDKQASVSLASFRGQKPVVLIFGSYT
jgi:hypothetical protein